MKLYGLIGTCSFVPHVALEWVKAHSHENYEFEAVSRGFSVIPKPSNVALFR